MPNLTTSVSAETYEKIEQLVAGSTLSPVRWLGLIALARVSAPQERFPKEYCDSGRYSDWDSRRIVAHVPREIKAKIRFWGMTEAEWCRAVIRQALLMKVTPADNRKWVAKRVPTTKSTTKRRQRRQKAMDRVPIFARVSGQLWDRFSKIAHRQKLRRAAALDEALVDWLAKHSLAEVRAAESEPTPIVPLIASSGETPPLSSFCEPALSDVQADRVGAQ